MPDSSSPCCVCRLVGALHQVLNLTQPRYALHFQVHGTLETTTAGTSPIRHHPILPRGAPARPSHSKAIMLSAQGLGLTSDTFDYGVQFCNLSPAYCFSSSRSHRTIIMPKMPFSGLHGEVQPCTFSRSAPVAFLVAETLFEPRADLRVRQISQSHHRRLCCI